MKSLRIKTGDLVMIMAGKDAGKKGKVIQVFPQWHKVVVEGINAMTKNVKARRGGEKGQKVQFNAPIHISNVMYIDSKSGQPTRLGSSLVGGKKVRRSIRSKETIS